MNVFLTVLEIVSPVFLLASIGFAWVRLGFEFKLEFVTRLTMTLTVPALIFTSLVNSELEKAALSAMLSATIACYFVITLIVLGCVKLFGLDGRTYLNPLIFGNTGNIGLPIAFFAFGATGISYAMIVFATMALWSFTFGLYVTSGGGNPLKATKEPLVWSTLLGMLFLWQNWRLPDFAMSTLELLGDVGIPMMLLTLGVAVARLKVVKFTKSAALSLAKTAICTAIAAVVAFQLDLDPIARSVLIVQFSMPIAVTSYMLAEKFEADADTVAGLVVVSTVLSVFYLPVLLALVI